MIRKRSLATRLGATGLAVFVIGAALLGTAVVAGASGTSSGCGSCSITTSPTTGLAPNQAVQVTGSGFTPKATGAVVECNLAPQEPTIAVPDFPPDFTNLGSLPVGCTSPNQTPAKVSSKGTIVDGMGIATGTVGPPASGVDSGGGQASADAPNYPCPPTQAQVTAGVSCALVYQDSKGEMASLPISFTTAFSTVTTTTTTTTAPPAANCTPTPNTVTTAGATITVDPATCLVGNQPVKVTGSGLKPNALSSLLECNTDPGQPTEFSSLAARSIPVGCSNLLTYVKSTNADGTLTATTFTILTGTVGPPTTGPPDSAGGDATADAAKYPCPPTAAQLAETPPVSCVLAFGDQVPAAQVADQVLVPLSFGSGPALAAAAGTKAGSSTAAAKAATTKASTGALAFTGAGPGLTALALAAVVLMALGGTLLVLVDGPRQSLLWTRRRGTRRRLTR